MNNIGLEIQTNQSLTRSTSFSAQTDSRFECFESLNNSNNSSIIIPKPTFSLDDMLPTYEYLIDNLALSVVCQVYAVNFYNMVHTRRQKVRTLVRKQRLPNVFIRLISVVFS